MEAWCSHPEVVHADGDIVCKRCGMVLEDEESPTAPVSESRVNLYEIREIGSREVAPAMEFAMHRDSGDIRRYFRGGLTEGRALSDFSNLCEKLSLPVSIQRGAWTLYCRAAESGRRRAAEHACWAIHNTCRSSGIPVSGDEIRTAAMSVYGRQSLPDMFTIAYRHMDIPGASREAPDLYYFNLQLRNMVSSLRMSDSEFASRKAQAWQLYRGTFIEGNPDCRARRAVAMAFGV